MKERPILFSGEMVQAILDGRKTQTRRVVKPQPPADCQAWSGWIICSTCSKDVEKAAWQDIPGCMPGKSHRVRCPYGQPGDRLWVKESWAVRKEYDKLSGSKLPKAGREKIFYMADGQKPEWAGRTRSSRFMPRWASRIELEITDVRVERVQDISEDDAIKEGITYDAASSCWYDGPQYVLAYANLWDSINAKRDHSWESNSWVWAIEFRRIP